MLDEHIGGTVEKFDDAMLEALSVLPGVKVYDSVRPDNDREGQVYVVYFPGDIIPGSAEHHQPVTGFHQASVIHTFAIMISAPSARSRRKLQAAVRRVVLDVKVDGCTPPSETGQLNSYGNTDNTVKPVRYTGYMTFKSTIDRSV